MLPTYKSIHDLDKGQHFAVYCWVQKIWCAGVLEDEDYVRWSKGPKHFDPEMAYLLPSADTVDYSVVQ